MEARFAIMDRITKELSKNYSVCVGILGEDASEPHKMRKKDGSIVTPKKPKTNAFIGAIHEYGSVSNNIPARSFLRYPIKMRLGTMLEKNKDTLTRSLVKGTYKQWLENLGFALEEIVNNAFETGGFGMWKPIEKQTARRKGSDMILVDIGQLKASISSEVRDD